MTKTAKRKALSLSEASDSNVAPAKAVKTESNTVKPARPHSVAFYLPKSWHVLLKKEAAVDDDQNVNDYLIEGLELWFKQKGIAYTETDKNKK